MFQAPSVRERGVRLNENRDQPGRDFQERLPRIRPERCQGREPFGWGAMFIKLAFLDLRRAADFAFNRRVRDRHKMPGLQIRAARCAARRLQTVLNYRARYRAIGEFPDRPSLGNLPAESLRSLD